MQKVFAIFTFEILNECEENAKFSKRYYFGDNFFGANHWIWANYWDSVNYGFLLTVNYGH